MYTSIDAGVLDRRNRLLGWIILAVVAGVVCAGAIYTVYLANTTSQLAALPSAPPQSTALVRQSKTDMLDGNYITTTALYRTTMTPVAVIQYYTNLLKNYPHQIGSFGEHADTILPARAPEALQHMPPVFASGTRSDPQAANYFYTEYSFGQNDVGIAVDATQPSGPTYVYQEMLTQ